MRRTLPMLVVVAVLGLLGAGLMIQSVHAAPAAEKMIVPVLVADGAVRAPEALAAVAAVDAASSPGTVLDQAVDAQRNGKTRAALIFLLMTVVGVVRLAWKTARETKWLGWMLNFAVSLLAALGAVALTDTTFSLSVVLNAFTTALAAAGGWEAIKDTGILGKKSAG